MSSLLSFFSTFLDISFWELVFFSTERILHVEELLELNIANYAVCLLDEAGLDPLIIIYFS